MENLGLYFKIKKSGGCLRSPGQPLFIQVPGGKSLTVFTPEPGTITGTALIICPGGGFYALSIDSEGFDVARWLTAKGVTCFVLKYHLVESKTDDPIKELTAKGPKSKEDVKSVIKLALANRVVVEKLLLYSKEFLEALLRGSGLILYLFYE